VLAERAVGQDLDEERFPFGDGGARHMPDRDWPEQCQSGAVAVQREPVPDVLVQVGVRAFNLSSNAFRGLRLQLLDLSRASVSGRSLGAGFGFD
jgi:hypothetical protein